MTMFWLTDIQSQQAPAAVSYTEFLRRPSMSAGIYRLHAGADDPQQPHDQDEIYYVLSGTAAINVAGDLSAVGPGAIVYIEAGMPHRFQDITADLELLVFFAPQKTD